MAFYLKEITKSADPALMASFEADRQNVSLCSLFHHFPNTAVVATGKKGFIQLVNLANGSFQTFLTHLEGVIMPLEAPLRFVSLSPALYMAHRECHHVFYALAHGSELLCANFNTGNVATIASFSSRPSAIFSDGEYVACGTSDGEVHVWRATTLLYDGAMLRTRPQGVVNMSIERSMMMMGGGGGGSQQQQHNNNGFPNYFAGNHNDVSNTSICGPTTLPNENGDVYPATFVNDSGSIIFRIKAHRSAISTLTIYRDLLFVAADDFSVTVHAMSPFSSSSAASSQMGDQYSAGAVLFHLAHPAARVKSIVGMSALNQRLCVTSERGGLTLYQQDHHHNQQKGGGGNISSTTTSDPWTILGSHHLSAAPNNTESSSAYRAAGRKVTAVSYHNHFIIVGTDDGRVTVLDAKDDAVYNPNTTNTATASAAHHTSARSKNERRAHFNASGNPVVTELVSFDVKHSVVSCEILSDDRLVVVTSSGDVWRWPMGDVIKAIPAEKLITPNNADGAQPHQSRQEQHAHSGRNDGAKEDEDDDEHQFDDDAAPPAPRADLHRPSPTPHQSQTYAADNQHNDDANDGGAANLFAFDDDALLRNDNNNNSSADGHHHEEESMNLNQYVASQKRSGNALPDDGMSSVPERATVLSAPTMPAAAAMSHHNDIDKEEVKRFPTRVSTTAGSQYEVNTRRSNANNTTTDAEMSILHHHQNRPSPSGGVSFAEDGRKSNAAAAAAAGAGAHFYDPNNYSAPLEEENGGEEQSRRKKNAADEALTLFNQQQQQLANHTTSNHKGKKLTVTIEGLKAGKRMDPRKVSYGLAVAQQLAEEVDEEGDDEDSKNINNTNKKKSIFNRNAELIHRPPHHNNTPQENESDPNSAAAAKEEQRRIDQYMAENPTVVSALRMKHSVSTATYSLHEKVYSAVPELASKLLLAQCSDSTVVGSGVSGSAIGGGSATGMGGLVLAESSSAAATAVRRAHSPVPSSSPPSSVARRIQQYDSESQQQQSPSRRLLGGTAVLDTPTAAAAPRHVDGSRDDDEDNESLPSGMLGSQSEYPQPQNDSNNGNQFAEDQIHRQPSRRSVKISDDAAVVVGSSPIRSSPHQQRPPLASGGAVVMSPSTYNANNTTTRKASPSAAAVTNTTKNNTVVDDLVDATFMKFARKKDERYERERSLQGPSINKHGCEDLLFVGGSASSGRKGAGGMPLVDRTNAVDQAQNTTTTVGGANGIRGGTKSANNNNVYVSGDGGTLVPPPATTIFFAVPSVDDCFFGGGGDDAPSSSYGATLFGKGPFHEYFIQSLPMAQ